MFVTASCATRKVLTSTLKAAPSMAVSRAAWCDGVKQLISKNSFVVVLWWCHGGVMVVLSTLKGAPIVAV
jgi:hypothetical protein